MDTDVISVVDLPIKLRELHPKTASAHEVLGIKISASVEEKMSLKESLEQAEKAAILNALSQAENNVTRAAKMLQVPRQTLQYKLKKLDIK
jgi:arginine utilization regulatory protein